MYKLMSKYFPIIFVWDVIQGLFSFFFFFKLIKVSVAFYLDRRGKQTDACECPMAAAASVHSFIAYCNLEAFFR